MLAKKFSIARTFALSKPLEERSLRVPHAATACVRIGDKGGEGERDSMGEDGGSSSRSRSRASKVAMDLAQPFSLRARRRSFDSDGFQDQDPSLDAMEWRVEWQNATNSGNARRNLGLFFFFFLAKSECGRGYRIQIVQGVVP